MKTRSILLSVLILSCLSLAQTPTDTETTVIHAGHMLDVKTGHITDNATLVIQGGKIVSVGEPRWTKPPANLKTVDLPNSTILPGLIDVHTHLTFDPNFGYQE